MHPLSDRDIQRRDIDGSAVPSGRCLRPWPSAHPADRLVHRPVHLSRVSEAVKGLFGLREMIRPVDRHATMRWQDQLSEGDDVVGATRNLR
jgi:hypothetical protein